MIDIVIGEQKILENFGKKLGYSKVISYKDLKMAFGSERKYFEGRRYDIIASLEKSNSRESLSQRNSGLNHVLCELARKNDIVICFNFRDLLDSNDKNKMIGRMIQNVMLCRKYKVKMAIASFAQDKYGMRNPNDLKSFCKLIGMTDKESKEALQDNINYILEEKRKAKGIKVV